MYANVLRAGTLNDVRVVQKVSANFVPTHFNNNDPTRDPNSPSALLWKSIKQQKELQGQGLWIVAPDGQVIAGMSAEIDGQPSDRVGSGPGAPWRANPKFADAALVLMDEALKKFGPVTQRMAKAEPFPFRGAGIKPDGGVRLIVYNKADNGLVFSVNLSKDDWTTFMPTTLAVGTSWAIPAPVAKQFAPVLSPYADTRFRPRVDDVKVAQMRAEVVTQDQRGAWIKLTGEWSVDWVHDGNEHSIGSATGAGFAEYDIPAQSMRSLLIIFDGQYSYTTGGGKPRTTPNAAVVRWRRDGDPE
jgi:hypothetical protein